MAILGFLLVLVFLPVNAAIKVTDDLGNEVVLPEPATRVVSLAPHLTELLFSLGVGDNIVGTSRYSDYPAAAKSITMVGDAFAVNVELIVSLRPNIVFAWSTGGTNRALTHLRGLGYAIYINEARTIAGIGDTLSAMAKLTGVPERGEELHNRLLLRLEEFQQVSYSASRPTVFFQISDQNLYSVNSDHLIGQAIQLCKGENVFAEQPVSVPLVSMESILMADPDVLVISKPEGNAESPWKAKWSRYPGFKEKLRWIDPGLISRPSLRMLEGIDQLCKIIHG